MPNLKIFNIGINISFLDAASENLNRVIFVPAMFRHLIRKGQQTGNVPELKEVQYYSDLRYLTADGAPNFTEVMWLFYLPSIVSITVRALDYDIPFQWHLAAPYLPALRTLNLVNSHIQLITLKTLLSWMPNLKRLEYQIHRNISIHPGYFLDCNMLRGVLASRAETLEQLVLGIKFYHWEEPGDDGWDNTEYGIIGALGDMNCFTKLQYLKAPILLLLGWDALTSTRLTDVLPASLREFCCTNDMSSNLVFMPWNNEVSALAQVKHLLYSRASQLRKFVIGAESGRFL
ncbi:MAG: hypothetical protein L6R41_006055 [Letrouitia leprolyta]|nr:MAG: hypothetical protein L6R41_006055 [Letrouitia leprolyta]